MTDLPTEEMIEAGLTILKLAQKRHANHVVYAEVHFVRDLYLAMKAVEPDGWEDIETAPGSGGTRLLCTVKEDRLPVVLSANYHYTRGWKWTDPHGVPYTPILCRPLPPSPEGV